MRLTPCSHSQAPCDGVAGCVKACQDEGTNLWQQLLLGQGLACTCSTRAAVLKLEGHGETAVVAMLILPNHVPASGRLPLGT